MPFYETNDSYTTKEVSLSGLVSECLSKSLCHKLAHRMVTNRGVQGSLSLAQAFERQELTTCIQKCDDLVRSCPDIETLKRIENEISAPNSSIIHRCEHRAEDMATYLFFAAHKPSKVRFENKGTLAPGLNEDELAQSVASKLTGDKKKKLADELEKLNDREVSNKTSSTGTMPVWK